MPNESIRAPGAENSPPPASRPGARHAAGAFLFLLAWLSFIVFVALYRAPLPDDAFAALGREIVALADTGVAR